MEYQSVGDGMVAINVEDELIPHVYSPLHLAGHQFPNISENIAPSNAGSTTIPTEISHSASSKQFGSPARQLHRQNSTPITQREIQEALDHSILSSDNDNSLLIHPQQDNHQETLDGRVGHQTGTAEDTAIGTATSEDYKWFERLKLVSSIGESTPRGLSEVVPTFYCNICLENSATSNGFILQKCSLRHQFCKACMGSYVESQIVDGCVHLGCPLVTACGCYAEDAEIEALCEEDIYSKYVKFKAMKDNPDMRSCPKCAEVVLGYRDKPSMQCPSCSADFCFFHSNAHDGQSCQDYALRMRDEEKLNDAYITSHSRPCPKCGFPTEKNGGCNHMTCKHCAENWCWLCGRHYEPDHYSLDNIYGDARCPGAQFAAAPRIALWNRFPWLRSNGPLSWLLRLPHLVSTAFIYLLYGVAVLLFVFAFPGVISAMGVLSCFCTPLGLRYIQYGVSWFDDAVVLTSALTFGLVLLVLECIWLPFSLMHTCVFGGFSVMWPVVVFRSCHVATSPLLAWVCRPTRYRRTAPRPAEVLNLNGWRNERGRDERGADKVAAILDAYIAAADEDDIIFRESFNGLFIALLDVLYCQLNDGALATVLPLETNTPAFETLADAAFRYFDCQNARCFGKQEFLTGLHGFARDPTACLRALFRMVDWRLAGSITEGDLRRLFEALAAVSLDGVAVWVAEKYGVERASVVTEYGVGSGSSHAELSSSDAMYMNSAASSQQTVGRGGGGRAGASGKVGVDPTAARGVFELAGWDWRPQLPAFAFRAINNFSNADSATAASPVTTESSGGISEKEFLAALQGGKELYATVLRFIGAPADGVLGPTDLASFVVGVVADAVAWGSLLAPKLGPSIAAACQLDGMSAILDKAVAASAGAGAESELDDLQGPKLTAGGGIVVTTAISRGALSGGGQRAQGAVGPASGAKRAQGAVDSTAGGQRARLDGAVGPAGGSFNSCASADGATKTPKSMSLVADEFFQSMYEVLSSSQPVSGASVASLIEDHICDMLPATLQPLLEAAKRQLRGFGLLSLLPIATKICNNGVAAGLKECREDTSRFSIQLLELVQLRRHRGAADRGVARAGPGVGAAAKADAGASCNESVPEDITTGAELFAAQEYLPLSDQTYDSVLSSHELQRLGCCLAFYQKEMTESKTGAASGRSKETRFAIISSSNFFGTSEMGPSTSEDVKEGEKLFAAAVGRCFSSGVVLLLRLAKAFVTSISLPLITLGYRQLQLFACEQLTDELSACLLRWEAEMGRKYGLSRLFRLLQENASARLRSSQQPV